jgi:small-conductance mechanosensitive channel
VPDSVGARVVFSVSREVPLITQRILTMLRETLGLGGVFAFLYTMATDPLDHERLLDTGWRLAVMLSAGIAVEVGVRKALRPIVRRLNARAYLASAKPGNAPLGEGAATDSATLARAAQEDDGEGGETEGGDDAAEDGPTDPIAAAMGESAAPEAGETKEEKRERRRRRRRLTVRQLLKRVPFVALRVAIELLPLAVFALITYVLVDDALGETAVTKLVLLDVAAAYCLYRGILSMMRVLFSPDFPRLRLIHVSTPAARYGVRWTWRILAVAIGGATFADTGLWFGLSDSAYAAFMKADVLIVHIFVAIITIQKRKAVALWIAGKPARRGFFAVIRRRFAAVWYWVALFYNAALWVVWAAEIPHGYYRLLRVFLVTAGIMGVARIAVLVMLQGVERFIKARAETSDANGIMAGRLDIYRPLVHGLVHTIAVVAALVLLLQVWGVGALRWLLSNDLGHQVASATVTVAITLLVAIAVWELVNIAMLRQLSQLTADMQLARVARLRTLQPMLRSVLAGIILIVVALTVLSEIGVNIEPLLAGAGVVGIAIGFGSQKLVQDMITGLFLLLENAMQVGDVVSLGGLTGTVETLSIRTIRLRGEDGSVHVIPFSAVTTVTNQTRDYGYAVIEVAVGYREDYAQVVELMQDVVKHMREDPAIGAEIREDVEMQGLNRLSDAGVVMKCRIRCGPFGRWKVGREFNRLLKERFDAANIYIVRQGFADEALSGYAAIIKPLPREEKP